MKQREFLNQVSLNIFAKELNAHAGGDSWRSERTIEIKITDFARNIHHVGHDANCENTLVELQTATLNATQVTFRRSSNFLRLYALVPSQGSEHGGERLERQWLVELRDPKGKKHSFCIPRHVEESSRSNSLSFILKQHSDEQCEQHREIFEDWEYGGYDKLESILPEGWRIVTNFEFNFSRWFHVKGVKRTKQGVTLAYETNGTYQSLPCLMEIKKQTATKVVSLSDLGVETSGYYSHDTHLYIRPEQVKAAKKLAARVRRMKGGNK